MWIWVARWLKRPGQEAAITQAADHIRRHWEEVCLDVGYDPAKNVTVAENDKELRVGISEELDMTFREEPGEWRYY
ncbi:hypothetical protein [Desulfovibrio sp. TomC]|uniref:hypothetical protein n=1 Tax=Desulfovibrio sp. TomC TaxID=1562888 RepID=UPI000573F7C3|nr:hypothetical protein [Desulfovibrio sp. TomC]KHK01554.1 hypothetical protein NY78_3075 [Desulfovibrio sp. TomC]